LTRQRFVPEFDVVAMLLSVAALLILLFFGIGNPDILPELGIAFAFWFVGFLGPLSLGLVQKPHGLSLGKLFGICTIAGLVILAFFGMNFAYSAASSAQDVFMLDKAVSFAVGVSEELFFGVFLLTLLINWVGTGKLVAIVASSAVHAVYHIPTWGSNIETLAVFFGCFLVARTAFVYVMPKVGVILGAHGLWNVVAG